MEKQLESLIESNRYLQYYLDNCVRCGACIESCHFFQGDSSNKLHIPVYKNELVRRLQKQNTLQGKLGLHGKLEGDPADSLVYAVFETCTNCRRCVMHCPLGIDISMINTAARTTLVREEKAPEMLLMLADMQMYRRENPESFKESFQEQFVDHVEQIREEFNDPSFDITISEDGADVLYVPLSGIQTIIPAAKILHAAGEKWTLSLYESSNYGFLIGDSERALKITKPIIDEAKRIGAKKVVLTECGHGYRIMTQFAEQWFGELPFEVELIDETIARYIKENKITLDKSKNPGRFTHHDSCQQVRNGGIIEEPRFILNHAVQEFIDMVPNREQNWCCGGGGGVVGVPEFNENRLKGGKPKAEQIQATGAQVVTSTCDNCTLQLRDINEHYDLNVKVEGVMEVVANALVYQGTGS